MKKLILTLLFIHLTTLIFAQLQEKLFQEFLNFVATQNMETPLKEHKNPVLYLPFEKSDVAHKTSKKMQVLQ